MSRWSPGGSFAGLASTAAPSLLVLIFLSRASQNAGQTTFPLIGRDLLGMGQFSVGTAVAAAGLANVLSSTVVIRGRRLPASDLLAVGQILALASFVLLAVPAGRIGLWMGAIGVGAAAGIVFPSLMTVVASGSGGRRTKALALMSLVLSASLIVGPLLEAAILRVLGNSLRGALAAFVALPAAAAVLAGRAALRDRRRVRSADLLPAPADAPAGAQHGTAADGLGGAFRLALTVMLTYQVPFAAIVGFGALLARRSDGLSASGAQLAFGVFFATSAAVRLVLAAVNPDRHIGVILPVSALLTMVGVAGVGLARNGPELLGAMAVLGVPHGTTFPLASSILAEHARVDERQLVRANGRLMAGTNAASVIVPFMFGWVASLVGYRTMFLLLEIPVVVAVAFLVMQLLSPRSPLRQPRPATRPSLPGP